MNRVATCLSLSLIAASIAPKARGQEGEGPPAPIAVQVNDKSSGDYLLVTPEQEGSPDEPAGLLVVLPGGDGSADFHPFVRNIQRQAVGEYLVAQPIAVKWREDQEVVWPTLRQKVPSQKFATEQFVAMVIEDVAAKHEIDRQRVFLLAWSSGGPAAYATMLQKDSPATGALIAMSVFFAKQAPVKNGAGRSFYLLHSPEDEVCRYFFAQQASEVLKKAGADTTLVNYEGGHGWHGDVFGNIRAGIEWLEQSTVNRSEAAAKK